MEFNKHHNLGITATAPITANAKINITTTLDLTISRNSSTGKIRSSVSMTMTTLNVKAAAPPIDPQYGIINDSMVL